MTLTYANIPLGFPDQAGAIQDWLDRWLPLSDSRMIAEWPCSAVNRGNFSGTSAAYYPGQGLPLPNYSRPISPRLNTWSRPTGASRWSFGFFLADYASLQRILAVTDIANNVSTSAGVTAKNNPASLLMESPIGYKRTWQAYMLPPHPVSAVASNATSLWLVPLVDDRFWWQFSNYHASAIDNTSGVLSWDTIFAPLYAYTTITPSRTTPTAYLKPNPFILNGMQWQNFAVFADALAHSIGLRIVPSYGPIGFNTNFAGGNYRAIDFTATETQRRLNDAGAYDVPGGHLQAGSISPFPNSAAINPANIQVIFRGWANGVTLPDWKRQRYFSTIAAPATVSNTAGYTKFFRSTALADYSSGGQNPDNQAALDALATQIANDFYLSLGWIQDSAIVGISQWQETGYDDYVSFTMTNDPEFGWHAETRVHTTPYNSTLEDLFHWDQTTWEYGSMIYGTLNGTLNPNSTQTISVLGGDSAIPAGGATLRVSETFGQILLNSTIVQALRKGDVWAVIEPAYSSTPLEAIGSSASIVLSDNTGTFTLSTGGTITAKVRRGLCFANENYLIVNTVNGYEIANPSMSVLVTNATGATIGRGAAGTATIMTGTPIGSETAGAITITVYCRYEPFRNGAVSRAQIGDSDTADPPGWELQNTEDILKGQASITDCTGGVSVTFTIYAGTPGSESSTSQTISAFVRKGLILPSVTYKLQSTADGYECIDPSLTIRGQTTADVAADASGSLVVYTGTGAGVASAVTVGSIRNDSSCTIKTAKLSTAQWHDSLNGWLFSIWHSS